MKFKHIYIINKFENSKLLESQILDMLDLEKDAFVIFNLKYPSNISYVKNLMLQRKYDYRIVKNIFGVYKVICGMDGVLLIHARDFYSILVSLFLRVFIPIRKKIFLLYDVRGLMYDEMLYANSRIFNRIKARIKEFFNSVALRNSDALSFVTNNLKEVINTRYESTLNIPSLIIPTCVSNKYVNKKSINSISHSSIKIIYSGGTVSKWHQFSEVIKSLYEISKLDSNIEIILCVDDINSTLDKIENIGLQAKVINLPHDEVIKLLLTTDYGIIIRDNSLVNYVAAPTKLTEYLATGNKIIYSGVIGSIKDIGDREIFNDNFILLEDILEGRVRLRANCQTNSHDLITFLLWENNIQKYSNLIDVLVGSFNVC